MLTEKDYCDYCDQEIENELVRIGFPIKQAHLQGRGVCVTMHISLYEAQKWLREEKKIDVLIQLETKDIHLSSKYYSIYISYMSRFRREFKCVLKNFDSYEEALSEGVKCAVKILKEK